MTRPDRHPRRNATMPDRAHLELRVDPAPVQLVRRCMRCADPLPAWAVALCDDCIGRGGNPIGCLALAIAFLIVAFIAASVLAAPRSAQTTLSVDVSGQRSAEPTGAPRVDSRAPASSAATVGQASTGGVPHPPAVANVATSEGLPGPTTPMPAPRFRGLATWYCLSGSSACTRGFGQNDLVAAIDTDLGFGKGDRIRVRYGDRSVVVTVVDVCGCPGDRLVDLTSGAFRELANLDVGVLPVTVEAAGPGATLPATEAAP